MIAFIPGLPVYGGLARSKINEYSGSKTLLSGVALAFFTFLAVQFLLSPLAWLPVLSPPFGWTLILEESVVVSCDFDGVSGTIN